MFIALREACSVIVFKKTQDYFYLSIPQLTLYDIYMYIYIYLSCLKLGYVFEILMLIYGEDFIHVEKIILN